MKGGQGNMLLYLPFIKYQMNKYLSQKGQSMVEYALVLVFVVAIATLAYSGETRQAVMNAMGKVVNDVSAYLSGGGASDGGGSA